MAMAATLAAALSSARARAKRRVEAGRMDKLPLGARIKYLFDNSPKLHKLAQDWDADGIIGLSSRCLSEEVDLTDVPYDQFLTFAEAVLKTIRGNYVIVALSYDVVYHLLFCI